jgi:hypothetical protein
MPNDPRIKAIKEKNSIPVDWLGHVESLLSLPDDLHRHALVFFAHQLNWLYWIDQNWTETNILHIMDTGDVLDQNAIWSGFFWGARFPSRQLYLRIKPKLLSLSKNTDNLQHEYYEVLAGLILGGWGNILGDDGKCCISNSELRDVLLHADDEFRSQILWHLEHWIQEDDNDVRATWLATLPEFFTNVWPRQKSVRTSTMSARLSNFILSDAKYFPEVADIVIPLLTPTDQDSLMLLDIQKDDNIIIDSYPGHVLAILHAVLPENIAIWPYGIETILQRIGKANATLKSDSRLIELKRKWNSR